MSAKVEENLIVLKEPTPAPATPASGSALIYPNSSDLFRQLDDAGVDRPLTFALDMEDLQAGTAIAGVNEVIGYPGFATILSANDVSLNLIPNYVNRQFWFYDASAVGPSNSISRTIGMFTRYKYISTSLSRNGDGEVRLFNTDTTTGVNAGILNTANAGGLNYWVDSACEFLLYAKVRIPTTIADIGVTVGIASAEVINDDITTDQGVYFRYSTSASDPGWVGVVHASSANRTVTGSLATILADTTYELLLYLSSDGVRFSVNGAAPTLVAYPSGFGGLGMGFQLSVLTKTTVAKTLEIYKAYAEGK